MSHKIHAIAAIKLDVPNTLATAIALTSDKNRPLSRRIEMMPVKDYYLIHLIEDQQ
jgi:hypothetical protein